MLGLLGLVSYRLAHSIKAETAVHMALEEVVAIMEEEAVDLAMHLCLALEEDPAMWVAVQTLEVPQCCKATRGPAPV